MAGRGEDFGRVDQQFEGERKDPQHVKLAQSFAIMSEASEEILIQLPGAKPRGQSHVPVRRADANESSVSHASHPSVAVDVAFV